MAPRQLRILVFPETHRTWTARGLEHDLAAGGRTIESAVDTLLKIVRAHIDFDLRHHHEPLSAFAAAPSLYWSAFTGARRLPLEMELDWSDRGRLAEVVAAVIHYHPGIRQLPEIAQSA
jgi:hypothetical protein